MADVAGIGSATTSSSANTTASGGIASMAPEDFFGILIAQLQQQDPMNPMSNEAMVQQMATIRDMEMSYTLTETLKQMTNEQRFAGAAGLIGKFVEGVVEDAEGEETTLEGVVTGIRFTEKGKAILELDTGESLPMEKLTRMYGTVPNGEPEASDGVLDLASMLDWRNGQCTNGSCPGLLGGLARFGMQNNDGLNVGLTLG